MSWKDEHGSKRPEDYCDPYTYRMNHLWKAYPKEEGEVGGMNLISFFVKKSRGQAYDISGVVFQPKEFDFTLKMETQKVIDLINEKTYTKKVTKGRRRTVRKEFLEMPEYETYSWIALREYCLQAFKEGSKYCLLSPKEYSMLQPTLSKKEQKKRDVDKALRNNFISY